ncbi:MAG: hypothetical protein ACI8VT_003739 [Saprospiraceae bacterium]|jgi:hypothetical protein
MKLIILGNGFDLHHKYPTSFYDFRMHLKNSPKDEDHNLVSEIDKLIKVSEDDQKIQLLWNDFESIIGKTFNSTGKNHDTNIIILIEEFTQKFYKYLLGLAELNEPIKNKKLAIEFESASSVLTFNYTQFYKSYFNDGNIDVFHIHGGLAESNLPIIGFYYPNTNITTQSFDFAKRYGGKLLHKPALAYKQNEIDLDANIDKFTNKWRNKITDIVIMGYSFGESDRHIFKILNSILIKQINEINVPSSIAKKIKLINIAIYSYKDEESEGIIRVMKHFLKGQGRRFSVNVTGLGFTTPEKDILTFELKKY